MSRVLPSSRPFGSQHHHQGFMRGVEPPWQLAQLPFFLRLARKTNNIAVMMTTAAAIQVCQSEFIDSQKPRSFPP